MANNTIFDDVFRTMLEKMPELVIPLINEVFGTNYPADIPIEQQRNEHQTKSGEKITDSRLKIADKIYHIECQSTSDTEMVIRMIEYDFAISLESKKIENGRYRIYFPHSCVLYLRGKGKSNTIGMDIVMPNGQIIKYDLPAIYVENYTTDVIFQKKLLFLLPFYIMRYENSRTEIEKDATKLQSLLDEYAAIVKKLKADVLHKGREVQYNYLMEVIKRIADYIFSNFQIAKEGMDEVMGGKVLELETDKVIKKIRDKYKDEIKAEIKDEAKEEIAIRMLKRGRNTLEEIAEYTDYPLEQIKKIKEDFICEKICGRE